MKIIKNQKKMKIISESLRNKLQKIGFVATMGYLHQGHLSLVKESIKRSDVTVVSIFVNPIQFTPKEDLHSYPRDLRRDIRMLKELKVDYVFAPGAKDMYPDGYNTYVVPEGRIVDSLCGIARPEHFKGVATVVTKLFNIIKPTFAFLGRKDFQQCVVIKKIVKDLNFDIKVITCETIREKDGLAMSSRNAYLLPVEREFALILYKSLNLAKNMISSRYKKVKFIIGAMKKLIEKETGSNKVDAEIDYISIVNADTLEELKMVNNNVLIALAVKIGKTRLIDNILIKC